MNHYPTTATHDSLAGIRGTFGLDANNKPLPLKTCPACHRFRLVTSRSCRVCGWQEPPPPPWWVTWIFGLLALTILLPKTLLSAPAPLPRRTAPQTCLQGRWRLDWGDRWYIATLSPGGHWRCEDERGVWLGDWSLEDRRLSVRESLGGSTMAWSVVLDGELVGRTNSGVVVKLKR